MSAVDPVAAPVLSSAERPSLRYAWFVVTILMLAYVFSFIDRQILNLLVAPIRRDLGISDTQISLLMGFSFAVFYTILGIPLGRLADRGSRRGLITAGVIVWSVMTALCGVAGKFWQFFLARIGVGVGEAALSPAAYSMIADYFPRERRATAISVYSMGIYIGSGLAYLLGALVIGFVSAQDVLQLPVVGATHPWQVVFFVIGGAGIVFSAVFVLVREPARQGVGTQPAPLSQVFAFINRNRRAVLCHNFGFALIAFVSYGTGAWIPTYFVRAWHWTPMHTGQVFGVIIMVFGSAGIVCGGRLADWLQQRGMSDACLRIGMWAALALLPLNALYLLLPGDGNAAALALVPAIFVISMPFGVAAAGIQEIMPNAMRGQASAVYLFIVNFIGLGLGPTAVALFTDKYFHDDGALQYSMAIISVSGCAVAAAVLRAGLAPYRDSLARMRAAQAAG